MLSNEVAGKVAIVTGASRGIGAAAARAFAESGASVVLAARTVAAIERQAQALRTRGMQVIAVPTDVTVADSVRDLVVKTLQTFGRLDAAFNCAGGGSVPASLIDTSVDAFEAAVTQNLRSVFISMKYEIEAMLKTGGGAIVNVASTAGLEGVRGLGAYAAAKHGVIGLTKSAALEFAEKSVRINAIAPGPTLTERLAQASPQTRDAVAATLPTRRLGAADEIAAAALWLCSPSAAFVTGTVLVVDGGKLAGHG